MTVEVIREVRLYGPLGRRFGRVHRLAVATPAEAAQALCAVLPGFERAFVGAVGAPPARYHVFVGRGPGRECIGIDRAVEPVGRTEPIRFVPVIEGAKRGGVLQTVAGVALAVVGTIYGQPWLVQIGASLALGGLVQVLSPQRLGGANQAPEKLPSYGMDGGPVNTTQQGLPVPLGFGRMVIGSAEISAGLSADDMVPAAAPAPIPPATLPDYMPPDPYQSTSDGP